MATKKKASKAKTAKHRAVPRQPRSQRLPGMEDAGIKELESIAEQLADVRSERIRLSKEEGTLQDDLLAVMKKHRKIEYHHEDVHVWVTASEVKVKVTIGEVTPTKEKKMKEETASIKELEEAQIGQDEPDTPETSQEPEPIEA